MVLLVEWVKQTIAECEVAACQRLETNPKKKLTTGIIENNIFINKNFLQFEFVVPSQL